MVSYVRGSICGLNYCFYREWPKSDFCLPTCLQTQSIADRHCQQGCTRSVRSVSQLVRYLGFESGLYPAGMPAGIPFGSVGRLVRVGIGFGSVGIAPNP